MNSQYERTRLAWRRTILSLLVVGGLGATHLALYDYPAESIAVLVLTVAAVVPALKRLRALRREVPTPSWQPAVLTAAVLLMALSAFVPA